MQYTLEDLLFVMSRLRDPQTGCPWNCQQTFQTIAPYTLEEAYEVVDAIERGDLDHLEEELGDLLFQVVYHARMAEEQQRFDFLNVVSGLVDKLIRRHPHIFPDGTLNSPAALNLPTALTLSTEERPELSAADVRETWQEIKSQEKAEKAQEQKSVLVLDGIPANLPALVIAQKLQQRAARVNFDWPDVQPVLAKLREELDEIEAAIAGGNQNEVREEVGDFLFAATNLARHLDVDAEQAVRGCNQKFRDRFAFIEQAVKAQGKVMEECTLKELDALWDQAKISLKH